MGLRKVFSGFTDSTAENLMLDAGAFFKNFDMDTDSFDSAVTEGKLLGATRGGGQFEAKPEIRSLEVDGVKGKAKGLQVIDSWEVKISANILEITKEVLADALAASKIEPLLDGDYDVISATNSISMDDYIENITYVGKRSGSTEPIIIQVYNALNTEGLSLQTQDKGESVIALSFEGHYDASRLDEPPFKIFYPKNN